MKQNKKIETKADVIEWFQQEVLRELESMDLLQDT